MAPAKRAGLRRPPLPVPVVEAVDAGHEPDPAEVDLAGAWVVRDVVRLARPVRQDREPGRAGAAEGVGEPRRRRPRDHVAGPHRVLLVAEQARALAREDDEDL